MVRSSEDGSGVAQSAFEVSVEREPDATVVKVEGEVDLYSVPHVRTLLWDAFDAESRTVSVDLSQVSFIDSSGLGLLVGAQRKAELREVAFTIRRPSPPVFKVLEITGLVSHIAVER